MDEPPSLSHATPLANRHAVWDDSGYLTNTPESTDSVRFSSRFNLSKEKKSFEEMGIQQEYMQQPVSPFLPLDNGSLYTPESACFKSVRCVPSNFNKPFPISTEESQVIEVLAEPTSHWVSGDGTFPDGDMYVDNEVDVMRAGSEDYAQEVDVYLPDPLDRSLYEAVQHEKSNLIEKQYEISHETNMEIDEDVHQIWHPNSENEEWDEQDDKSSDKLLKTATWKSVSLDTLSGQNLLLKKLEKLQPYVEESKTNSWRDQLKKKGCRYAKDFSGKSTVDFLLHLGVNSNHTTVVTQILSYLSPTDLQTCSYVSKAWRSTCSQDYNSVVRLNQYTRELASLKENSGKHTFSCNAHQFGPLATIQNFLHNRMSPPTTPPASPNKVRFALYVDALKNPDKSQRIMPCPRCGYPAKVDKVTYEAQCNKGNCQYLFCSKCCFEGHHPKSCLTATGRKAKKRGAIGSKESRKNLRRLL